MRVHHLLWTLPALWQSSFAQFSFSDLLTNTDFFPTSTLGLASFTAVTGFPTGLATVVPTAVPSASARSPCATVSYLSSNLSPTDSPVVPISVARDCLQSVPIVKDDALKLIDGMVPFLQFQSTLAFLQNPPKGYPLPPTDVLGGVQKVRDKVVKGSYKGEYDFQLDLWDTLNSAHDGHLSWQGDALASVLKYEVGWDLVSVSPDGKALPSVYIAEDVFLGRDRTSLGYTPSPVTTIDGKDIVTALKDMSLDNRLQDYDALYNTNFIEIAHIPINKLQFTPPKLKYPGDSNTFKFANGTERTIQNYATIRASSFRGVVDGATFYRRFCSPIKSRPSSSSGGPGTTRTTPRTPPFYPTPEVIHSEYAIGGYYLNDSAFADVAVLTIPSFDVSSSSGGTDFQDVLQQFLANAKAAGKKKLIVDLQANPGGLVDLGYEVFRQLFPNLEPYGASVFRAHSGLNVIGQTITDRFQHESAAPPPGLTEDEVFAISLSVGLNALDNLKPDGSTFSSWSEFFGPQQANNDKFTSLSRMNLSNPFQSLYSAPFINITGYGGRANLLAKEPPFAADNIIMLTDGFCASTCAIFAEFMKTQAKVKSYTFGGRPQKGAMQAVGGTKGSQAYPWRLVVSEVGLAAGLDLLKVTETEKEKGIQDYVSSKLTGTTLEGFSFYALNRSASGEGNLKNNIRFGDNTLTPLQFVYEAADCRLWYTPKMINDISEIWRTTADAAWGKGNSLCVEGSTNDPSSLSGGGDSVTVTIGSSKASNDGSKSAAVVNKGMGLGMALVVAATVVGLLL